MGTGDIYKYSLQDLQNAYTQRSYATIQATGGVYWDNGQSVNATPTITTTPTTPVNKTLLLLEDV